MDAASMLSGQKKRKRERNSRRHIPLEAIEEILLNLPVKSLVRFSSVSKSWNAMISEPDFAKRYRSRAALPGRERMVISSSRFDYLHDVSCCPLSHISDQPIEHADLICPIQEFYPASKVHLLASCDELWGVSVSNSLFLWNPSMNTYRKLPDPSLPLFPGINIFHQFGLGYDSIGDDYKILKLPCRNIGSGETELYSLKSNSWRKTRPFPGKTTARGVFLSGALHWMIDRGVIISFDLSTEKYGEVAQPEYSPTPSDNDRVEVTALRGMLCASLNYYTETSIVLVLWVMEDYGVGESWTRKFEINYCNSIPSFPQNFGTISSITLRPSSFMLRPLYFYDNGQILIKVSIDVNNISKIFIYEDERNMKLVVGCGRYGRISNAFLYVESLASPAMWPMSAAVPPVGNDEA